MTTPAHATLSTHALLIAASCIAAWLLVLWLKARLQGGRLARSVSRAYAPTASRRRPTARTEHRMVARSARSRRASRQLRKALLISVLIAAAVLFTHLHPHAH